MTTDFRFYKTVILPVVALLLGSLTLTHGLNSQKSFRYGFFYVKFLFLYVVCVVFLWYN